VLAALGTVVVTSLSGVMMPGPMFTVTLAKSLKSPWAGVMVSLGHAVVEVPLIVLVYFGLAEFFQNEILKLVLSVVGGGMIVWMGYDLFRARKKIITEGKDTRYNAFTAGILMSGLNPFFLLWWVTVGSLLLVSFKAAVGSWGLPFFIIVHWLCDLVWLSVVSYAIYRTHKFWGERVQELVFILLSAFLFYFGGMFVVKGVDDYLGTNTWNWIRCIFWSLGFIFILYFLVRYIKSRDTEATSSSSRT
jgi:threonine/homoserine/homoserine lactone efflux protein